MMGFSIDNNQQLYDKQGKFKIRPVSPVISAQAQKKKERVEQAEEALVQQQNSKMNQRLKTHPNEVSKEELQA